MRALVTGATGCIGSYLAEELLRHDYEVRVLVRHTSNLSEIAQLPLGFIYGDVTDPASVAEAVRDVDIVFHAAARMNDWGPWKIFHEQNIRGTLNLLQASQIAGVKRFVHTSSTGVTGLDAQYRSTEDAPYRPKGHYEESKVESEKLVVEFCNKEQLPYTIVRPCWTLGPRARRHIPLMIEYLRSGTFKILGSGRNVLNFVDPRDVAVAMVLVGERPEALGQIYHITNDDHTVTQESFYRTLCEFVGPTPPLQHVPYWLAYAISWLLEKWAEWRDWEDAPMLTPVRVAFLGLNRDFSCEKAKKELGYSPQYTLRHSLHDAAQWYSKLNEKDRAKIPELRGISVQWGQAASGKLTTV